MKLFALLSPFITYFTMVFSVINSRYYTEFQLKFAMLVFGTLCLIVLMFVFFHWDDIRPPFIQKLFQATRWDWVKIWSTVKNKLKIAVIICVVILLIVLSFIAACKCCGFHMLDNIEEEK